MTYTDLDPGGYVLRVRAANNDGVWNDDGLGSAGRPSLPRPGERGGPTPIYGPWRPGGGPPRLRPAEQGLAKTSTAAASSSRSQARTEELARENDRSSELNAQLVETSLTDSLTGLRNRRYLFEQVGKEMSLVQRHHRSARAACAATPTSSSS